MHNANVVGNVYVAKACRFARHAEGDIVSIPEDYHRAAWEALVKMTDEVGSASLAKA